MKSKSQKVILFYLLIGLLFLIRIYNIDNDPPSYDICYYQPIDEGQYAMMALNQERYGTINVTDDNYEYSCKVPPNLSSLVLTNIVTYISLQIFGNNYLGLRFSSIFFSFMILVILFLFTMRFQKEKGNGNNFSIKGMMFVSIFLLFDFNFLVTSRMVEPTIVRTFFLLLVLYSFYILDKKLYLRYFVLSFLSIISIFLVYASNLFILIPLGVLILYEIYQNKSLKILWFALLGMFLAYFISEIYYQLVFHISAIENIFKSITDFSSIQGYTSFNSNKTLYEKIFDFSLQAIGTNMFYYNVLFAVLGVISLFINLIIGVKEKKRELIYIVAIVFAFFLQTAYSTDFAIKKATLLFPIILISIVWCFKNIKVFIEYFQSKNMSYFKVFMGLGVVFISSIFLKVIHTRSKYSFDLKHSEAEFIFWYSVFEIIVLGIFCIICVLKTKKNIFQRLKYNHMFTILFILSLIPNIFFSVIYVYNYQSYGEKQIMMQIRERFEDDENILGGDFMLGYGLYTNLKPIVARYEKYGKYIENDDVQYFMGYENYKSSGVIDNVIFKDSDYTVTPYIIYERNYTVLGEPSNVCIYKKEKKKTD